MKRGAMMLSRVCAILSASCLAAATAFLALAPASARAAEQAIPFHGQDSAIFVQGDPLIHWIEAGF